MKLKVLQPIHSGTDCNYSGPSMFPASHGGVSHGEVVGKWDGIYDVDPALGEQLISEGKAVKA